MYHRAMGLVGGLAASLMLICSSNDLGAAGPGAEWLLEGLGRLPAGVEMLGGAFPSDAYVSGVDAVRRTSVDTGNPALGTAARIETPADTDNPWSVQIGLASGSAIAKGDVGLAILAVRSAASGDETGAAQLHAKFQRRGAPYEALGEAALRVSGEWQRVYVPFVAKNDYGPGETLLVALLGFGPQTMDFGPAMVLNYGDAVSLDDLPRNAITYGGREPDAPWRAEAAARIEQLRKGDLTIRVVGPDDAPIAGARVRATLARHAFWFGNEISARLILEDSPDGEQYRGWVKGLFNIVCFGNDMKWGPWEGHWYGTPDPKGRTLEAIAWLEANGIALRGHTTVWARQMPPDVAEITDDEALRARVRKHITDYTTELSGRVTIYDLHSEPIAEPLFTDRLGMDEVVHWFNAAHAIDPNALLFANEYAIVSQKNPVKMRAFKDYVRYLLDAGAPIHGVSPQCHLGGGLPSMGELKERLDDLASLGLPIYPDQWEPIVHDEECQGAYVRDFYTMLFSHPSAVGVSHWGFWEGLMWKPEAAWFRKDWTIKPSGRAYMDLVLGEWKTDEEGVTGGDGGWTVRGFTGDYEVRVSLGEEPTTTTASLTSSGATVVVRLP